VDRRAQTAAIYFGAFATYWHFVLEAEVEDEEKVTTDKGIVRAGGNVDEAKQEAVTEANAHDNVAKSDDDTDDSIFIPLGRTRPRPKVYYKGSDQEWQSFMEFAHDTNRNALVRRETIPLV